MSPRDPSSWCVLFGSWGEIRRWLNGYWPHTSDVIQGGVRANPTHKCTADQLSSSLVTCQQVPCPAPSLHPTTNCAPCAVRASPLQVSIARCDSHELFRSVQDVRAVVVLLRRNGAFLPQPHQLATSLRSQAEEGGEPGSDGQPMFD